MVSRCRNLPPSFHSCWHVDIIALVIPADSHVIVRIGSTPHHVTPGSMGSTNSKDAGESLLTPVQQKAAAAAEAEASSASGALWSAGLAAPGRSHKQSSLGKSTSQDSFLSFSPAHASRQTASSSSTVTVPLPWDIKDIYSEGRLILIYKTLKARGCTVKFEDFRDMVSSQEDRWLDFNQQLKANRTAAFDFHQAHPITAHCTLSGREWELYYQHGSQSADIMETLVHAGLPLSSIRSVKDVKQTLARLANAPPPSSLSAAAAAAAVARKTNSMPHRQSQNRAATQSPAGSAGADDEAHAEAEAKTETEEAQEEDKEWHHEKPDEDIVEDHDADMLKKLKATLGISADSVSAADLLAGIRATTPVGLTDEKLERKGEEEKRERNPHGVAKQTSAAVKSSKHTSSPARSGRCDHSLTPHTSTPKSKQASSSKARAAGRQPAEGAPHRPAGGRSSASNDEPVVLELARKSQQLRHSLAGNQAAVECLALHLPFQLFWVEADPESCLLTCRDALTPYRTRLSSDHLTELDVDSANDSVFLYHCCHKHPICFHHRTSWAAFRARRPSREANTSRNPSIKHLLDWEAKLSQWPAVPQSHFNRWLFPIRLVHCCPPVLSTSPDVIYHPMQISEVAEYEYNEAYTLFDADFYIPSGVINMKKDYFTDLYFATIWRMLLTTEFRERHIVMKSCAVLSITLNLTLFSLAPPIVYYSTAICCDVISMLDYFYYIQHAKQCRRFKRMEVLYKSLMHVQISLLCLFPITWDNFLSPSHSQQTESDSTSDSTFRYWKFAVYVTVCMLCFVICLVRFMADFCFMQTSSSVNTLMMLTKEINRMKHRHRLHDILAVTVASGLVLVSGWPRLLAAVIYCALSVWALIIYYFASRNIRRLLAEYVQFLSHMDIFPERFYRKGEKPKALLISAKVIPPERKQSKKKTKSKNKNKKHKQDSGKDKQKEESTTTTKPDKDANRRKEVSYTSALMGKGSESDELDNGMEQAGSTNEEEGSDAADVREASADDD